MRSKSVEEAAGLGAGADHYRAYVGPPDRFDFMSASQFSLLFALGLRDHQSVLDFGCGSLRLGRLLIPYLQSGKYFGIDPNRWLIDEALDRELGRDAERIKQPRFMFNDDFDCGIFQTKFAFVIAQSIVTHCGPALFAKLMSSVAAVLQRDGLFAFSYCPSDQPSAVAPEAWVYPGLVGYDEGQVAAMVAKAGLFGQAIPWYHPGAAVWYLAALDRSRLPSPEHLQFLRGAVLNDRQFEASLVLSDAT